MERDRPIHLEVGVKLHKSDLRLSKADKATKPSPRSLHLDFCPHRAVGDRCDFERPHGKLNLDFVSWHPPAKAHML